MTNGHNQMSQKGLVTKKEKHRIWVFLLRTITDHASKTYKKYIFMGGDK